MLDKAIQVFAEQRDAASELQEKFDGLFPTWPTIVATLLALMILLVFLTKLLYNPVKKYHDDRKNYIQNNIDSAEQQNEEAAINKQKANDELINARLEAADIVEQARKEAAQVRTIKVAEAEKEAHSVIENAKLDIQQQREKFQEESKEQMVDLALQAAAQVIEKEVDNKTNRKLVENFIKGNAE